MGSGRGVVLGSEVVVIRGQQYPYTSTSQTDKMRAAPFKRM